MSLQDARGLAGIRVVELGQMVAVPWAAKLLADLGADVIKVEPPGGDRSRSRGPFAGAPDPDASGLFVYLNTNKRSMVADLSVAADRERVARLLADADLLLHDLSPAAVAEGGLDAGSLRSTHPGLVTVSVTPFGQTGPYSGYRAEEIQTVHGGGWGWLTPGCSDRPDLPPLKPFGHQADFQAGFGAATAAMAAVDRAQRTGVGDHLDFSAMAHVTGMLEAGFITWSYLREIPGRLGARVLNPWRIFPAADGEIFVVCVEQDQWMRLKELMGSPEWADMEIFDTVEGRFDAEDLLHMWLGEWIEPPCSRWRRWPRTRTSLPAVSCGRSTSPGSARCGFPARPVDSPTRGGRSVVRPRGSASTTTPASRVPSRPGRSRQPTRRHGRSRGSPSPISPGCGRGRTAGCSSPTWART
jgi:crotonobetainyl-CoA:carnitine CoA-transferase CaiB-like acyl-CoA transferase